MLRLFHLLKKGNQALNIWSIVNKLFKPRERENMCAFSTYFKVTITLNVLYAPSEQLHFYAAFTILCDDGVSFYEKMYILLYTEGHKVD